MTPTEAKAWLQEFLPSRDSRWWSASFYGGLLTMVVTEFPDFVPDQYEKSLTRLGVFLTVLGSKMGWSWAGKPESTQGPRPFNKPIAEHNDNTPAAVAAAEAEVKP